MPTKDDGNWKKDKGWEGCHQFQERYQEWRPKEEKSYWSGRKNTVKNSKQFRTSSQAENITINSVVVANIPWCTGKEWWEDHACSLCFCILQAEGTNLFFFLPLASPQPNECLWYKCPYLRSLKLHTSFGTHIQNYNSTFLTLSVLQIIKTKTGWRVLRLFWKAGQVRWGGGAAQYVRERFGCPALMGRDDAAESVWVRIRGWETKQISL